MTKGGDVSSEEWPGGIDDDARTEAFTPGQDRARITEGNSRNDNTRASGSIGDYRIVRKIGEGGMGVVYEAEQQRPRRKVALKVIRGGLAADDQHVKMFEREIEALARLKHPGIASIYESGRSDDGQLFFAMELVKGRDLAEFVEHRRSVSGGEVPAVGYQLHLFTKVAEVVSYAHQRGIIHRDLKPQNILVTDDDDGHGTFSGERVGVKILDFGLARINDPEFRGNTDVSHVGLIKGTLLYISPEQVKGDPMNIDVRSDVYSLGVILYEMLTGSMPYDLRRASLPEAIRIILEEPPVPLSQALTSAGSRSKRIDRDVETVVLKALEKDPSRRYQSVAALLDDIERYLKSEPILARPPSPVYNFRKLVERHRAAFAALAAIFLLTAGFGVVMAAQSVRIASERDRAEQARIDADKQRGEAEIARNEALTARNEESKQRMIAEENLQRAEEEQKRAEESQKLAEEQRTFAQRAQLAEAEQRRLAEHNLATAKAERRRAEEQTEIAITQSALAEKSGIEANDRAEETRRLLYTSRINLAEQALADGKVIRVTELLEGQIPRPGQSDLRGFEWYHLWKLANRHNWTLEDAGRVSDARYSPDSRYLVVNSMAEDPTERPPRWKYWITIMDATSKTKLKKIEDRVSVTFLPDGRLAAAAPVAGSSIEFWNLEDMSAQSSNIKTPSTFPAIFPIASDDGKFIAKVEPRRTAPEGEDRLAVEIVDTESGAVISRASTFLLPVTPSVAFSKDNKILASASFDRVRLFDVQSGKELDRIENRSAGVARALEFSPNGSMLAIQESSGIRIFDRERRELTLLRPETSGADFGSGRAHLKFSPDNKWLAASRGRVVELASTESQKKGCFIRVGFAIKSIVFSPDGSSLSAIGTDGILRSWPTACTEDFLDLDKDVAATSGGDLLAGTTNEGNLRVRRLTDLSETQLIKVGGTPNTILVDPKFSSNGRILAGLRVSRNVWPAIASFSNSAAPLEIWDLANGSKRPMKTDFVKGFDLSADRNRVLTTSRNNEIELWDIESGNLLKNLGPGGLAVFSSDGKRVAIEDDDQIRTIDPDAPSSGSSSIRIGRGLGVPVYVDLKFSPHGSILAIPRGRDILLWSLSISEEIGVLIGHESNVSSISFSRDGRRLASVTTGGNIKIWDLDTLETLLTIRSSAFSVEFSSDGLSLITNDINGTKIWRAATDEEIAKRQGK